MYDSGGDGWAGNGALRVNVNGIDIDTVKVSAMNTFNTPVGQRYTNTFTFTAASGDLVQLFWVSGVVQNEISFIVYYTDTPPNPVFSETNKGASFWNGDNALLYRLRGTMNTLNEGAVLGGFIIY